MWEKFDLISRPKKHLLLPIKNRNISKRTTSIGLPIFSAKIKRETFETLKVSIVSRSIFLAASY